jgi:hypothetical protein
MEQHHALPGQPDAAISGREVDQTPQVGVSWGLAYWVHCIYFIEIYFLYGAWLDCLIFSLFHETSRLDLIKTSNFWG